MLTSNIRALIRITKLNQYLHDYDNITKCCSNQVELINCCSDYVNTIKRFSDLGIAIRITCGQWWIIKPTDFHTRPEKHSIALFTVPIKAYVCH